MKTRFNAFQLLLGLIVLMLSTVAMADINQRASSIMETVKTVAMTVAGGLLFVGVIVTGLKFSKGDPSATDSAVKWGIGAALIYAASEVITMFQNA